MCNKLDIMVVCLGPTQFLDLFDSEIQTCELLSWSAYPPDLVAIIFEESQWYHQLNCAMIAAV